MKYHMTVLFVVLDFGIPVFPGNVELGPALGVALEGFAVHHHQTERAIERVLMNRHDTPVAGQGQIAGKGTEMVAIKLLDRLRRRYSGDRANEASLVLIESNGYVGTLASGVTECQD